MPWSVFENAQREFCVVKSGSTTPVSPGSCHKNKQDAIRQLKALYANVPDAQTAAMSEDWPLDPPLAWFTEMPEWFTPGDKGTLITDGPEAGRFAATVAPRGQCILDGSGKCWTAPFSPTNYEAAMQGDTVTAEGFLIHTANIGGGIGHAPPMAKMRQAIDHYSATMSQLLRVSYQDQDSHIIALGAAWPDLSDRDIRTIQASALSGDWRFRPELDAYDLAGAQLVSVPGFPLMARKPASFQAMPYAASLTEDHPAIVGGWLEEDTMPPTPVIPLSPVEVEALRAMLAPAQTAACSCGAHTAAPPPPDGTNAPPMPTKVPDAAAGQVSADDFAALTARVEALEADAMDRQLSEVDAQFAALPEPATA